MTIRDDRRFTAGDLVLVELRPVRGTEQDGTRPAIVISDSGMHEFSRRALICPITRNRRPWPTKVMLPDGIGVQGAILVDQLRSIDRRERILRHLGTAPIEILHEVHRTLAVLLALNGPPQILTP